MIRFQFFPRSIGVVKPIKDVLKAFKEVESDIDSKTCNKKSDDVLAAGKKAAQDLKDGKVLLPYVMENDYQG